MWLAGTKAEKARAGGAWRPALAPEREPSDAKGSDDDLRWLYPGLWAMFG